MTLPDNYLTEFQTEFSRFRNVKALVWWCGCFVCLFICLFPLNSLHWGFQLITIIWLYESLGVYGLTIYSIFSVHRGDVKTKPCWLQGRYLKCFSWCSLTVLSLFFCSQTCRMGRWFCYRVSLPSALFALINNTLFPESKSCLQP